MLLVLHVCTNPNVCSLASTLMFGGVFLDYGERHTVNGLDSKPGLCQCYCTKSFLIPQRCKNGSFIDLFNYFSCQRGEAVCATHSVENGCDEVPENL